MAPDRLVTPTATPTHEALAQDPRMRWGTPLRVEDFAPPLAPPRWHPNQAGAKEPYPTSATTTTSALPNARPNSSRSHCVRV